MLFGFMYVLKLSEPSWAPLHFRGYPKDLDGGKLSNKALALKNRLSQWTGHTDITAPFFVLFLHDELMQGLLLFVC